MKEGRMLFDVGISIWYALGGVPVALQISSLTDS